jgi:hypothetical protein
LVDARSGESALYETDAYGRYVVVR